MMAKILDMILEERLTTREALFVLDEVRNYVLDARITHISVEDTAHEHSADPPESLEPSAEETTTPQPDGVPPVPLL